ncbi:MAG: DMT family transporter [Myxococcota bacterium]
MAREPRTAPPAPAVPALLVAVVAISFAAIFFRQASPTHPLVSAGLRLAVAAAVLWPTLLRARRRGVLRPRFVRAGVLGGLLYGLHFGAWVTSLTLTSVAASVTLVTATPLLLGLVAIATGRDRPEPHHWAALAMAAAGVTIIGWADLSLRPGALLGDGLALVGAAAMAGYLLAGRSLGSAMDVWPFTALATSVGAAALLGTAWIAGIDLRPASAEALGWLALAALVPQLVGHSLLTWSLRHTRPTVVGMATVGEPAGATLLAWIWLGEGVTVTTAVGCSITIAAVLLAMRRPPLRS